MYFLFKSADCCQHNITPTNRPIYFDLRVYEVYRPIYRLCVTLSVYKSMEPQI